MVGVVFCYLESVFSFSIMNVAGTNWRLPRWLAIRDGLGQVNTTKMESNPHPAYHDHLIHLCFSGFCSLAGLGGHAAGWRYD
jgi:hypothetical protein